VDRLDQAQVVTLAPRQALAGVRFALGPARAPRKIRVEVRWPDGTAPGGHLLQLSDAGELIRNVQNPGGVVEFNGWADWAYELKARYWVDDLDGGGPVGEKRLALTEMVKVAPGREAVTVRLVLSRRVTADEDP
jgi:hypothetical protein